MVFFRFSSHDHSLRCLEVVDHLLNLLCLLDLSDLLELLLLCNFQRVGPRVVETRMGPEVVETRMGPDDETETSPDSVEMEPDFVAVRLHQVEELTNFEN